MAKKIMSAFIAVMLVICASAIPAFAADGPSAYVSISDKDGKLVLVLEKIDLSAADVQSGGKSTHHQFFPSPLPRTTRSDMYLPAGSEMSSYILSG